MCDCFFLHIGPILSLALYQPGMMPMIIQLTVYWPNVCMRLDNNELIGPVMVFVVNASPIRLATGEDIG